MTVDAVRVFVALLVASSVVVLVSRRLNVPDEVALVIVGLIGALVLPTTVVVTPDLVLLVLLPGLVFEAAYRVDFGQLRRTLWAITLLAIPGVVITALVIAAVLTVTTGLHPALAFIIGAMLAPTDPAAMIAAFQRLRVPEGLSTLVESESLLNDGTAIVLFSVSLGLLHGSGSAGTAGGELAVAIVGSTIIGLALGFVASRVVATIDDYVVEITVSLALAYGAYLLADQLRLSGIIATVVAGIVLGNYGRRTGMSERTQGAVDEFWSVVGFILTAFVFLLIGVAIRVHVLPEALPDIVWGALAMLAARGIVVYGLLGLAGRILRVAGRGGLPSGWKHVMFAAGLRGAVAVALALSLPLDVPQRAILQETVFGIVLITILIQGPLAPVVTRRVIAPEETLS